MKNLLFTVNRNLFFMMTLFLSLALITGCEDDDPTPTPTPNPGPVEEDPSVPIANFSSQVDADNSLTYNFTNGSVVNGITDNTFTSAWDFGGDGTSADASPSHTFSGEGTYDVTLTITATDGITNSTSETIEVTAPKNRYATISDSQGDDNGGSDTGELRLAVDSIAVGRITFMYRVKAGPSGDIQDGFINIAGNSTTGDFSLVEVRLKDDAKHGFREGASDETIAAADANWPVGETDVWEPIEISWAADGVGYPTYSVSIAGQTIVTDAVSTTNGGEGDVDGHFAAVVNGAANFQWKYASNSAISDGMYQVDDIVVYSSDSGTETIVFEDSFQGMTAGDDLNPGEDGNTPYHVNTQDASVGEDE